MPPSAVDQGIIITPHPAPLQGGAFLGIDGLHDNTVLGNSQIAGNDRALGLEEKKDWAVNFGEAFVIALPLADDKIGAFKKRKKLRSTLRKDRGRGRAAGHEYCRADRGGLA